MRKLILASVASLALLATAPLAGAADWGFGAGGFAGGLSGQGQSSSGAGNLSGGFQFGNASSSSQTQSFGRAESGFGIGVGTLPDSVDPNTGAVTPGGSAAGAYGNFVGANVGSGSISNAMSASTGNGFAGAGTIGGGFGQTTLTGIGGAVGGFVTAP